MTEGQRQHALALCDLILATAAKLQADLREAKEVIEGERETMALLPLPSAEETKSIKVANCVLQQETK